MNNDNPPSGTDWKTASERVVVGEAVLVQADGFRCLAFRDEKGKWKDYFRQDELPGEIQVIKED